jgi:diacylglycerol kinase
MNFLKKRIASFGYAFEGILEVFRTQVHFKIHLLAAFLVISAGFYFNISNTEWSMIVICIALVMSAEAFNTAIENLTDLVSPDYHILAKKAKDTAAAAVLILAIAAAVIAFIIFYPKVQTIIHLSFS